MSTPLANAFYAAWQADGRTIEAIADRAGLSVPTAWAYINGTRGGGGQRRVRPTITALARVLGLDVEKTLSLAGLAIDAGVRQAILSDPALSRRDRKLLVALYEEMAHRDVP